GQRGSGIDSAATGERPALPLALLEDHHELLRVGSMAGQAAHEMRQESLLHLDASADRPQDVDEYEAIRTRSRCVRVRRVEAKVSRVQHPGCAGICRSKVRPPEWMPTDGVGDTIGQ